MDFEAIQKAITAQQDAKRVLPDAVTQFRVFLNRGKAKTDASQDTPKTTQGASADGTGKVAPEPSATTQGSPLAASAKDVKGKKRKGV